MNTFLGYTVLDWILFHSEFFQQIQSSFYHLQWLTITFIDTFKTVLYLNCIYFSYFSLFFYISLLLAGLFQFISFFHEIFQFIFSAYTFYVVKVRL